jgi:hypothetical protein
VKAFYIDLPIYLFANSGKAAPLEGSRALRKLST